MWFNIFLLSFSCSGLTNSQEESFLDQWWWADSNYIRATVGGPETCFFFESDGALFIKTEGHRQVGPYDWTSDIPGHYEVEDFGVVKVDQLTLDSYNIILRPNGTWTDEEFVATACPFEVELP